MIIETKYDIGQKVKFIIYSYEYDGSGELVIKKDNKIGYIREITINLNYEDTLVYSYTLTKNNEKFPSRYYHATEKNIFKI